ERSRRVEGSALPAQTAATSGFCCRLPPPHGPASLRLHRRVEGDPDPTLHLRADSNKKTPASGKATTKACRGRVGRPVAAAAAGRLSPGSLSGAEG
ncbi:unnamed protein product, partial [Pleuronectes platessa]